MNDARSAHSLICQALAGDPSRRLTALGVTGTFGKTVTSLFVHSILEAAGLRCGLVGSLGWSDGKQPAAFAGTRIDKGTRSFGHQPQGTSAGRAGAQVGRSPGAWPAGAPAWRPSSPTWSIRTVSRGCSRSPPSRLPRRPGGRRVPGRRGRLTSACPTACPPRSPSRIAGPRPSSFGRSSLAVPRSSTPTTRTPRSSVPSTSTPAASALAWHTPPRWTSRRGSSGWIPPAPGSRCTGSTAARGSTCALRTPAGQPRPGRRRAWPGAGDRPRCRRRRARKRRLRRGPPRSGRRGPGFRRPDRRGPDRAPLNQALTAIRAVAAGQVHCVLSAEGHQDHDTREPWPRPPSSVPTGSSSHWAFLRTEAPDQILDDLLGGFHRPGKVRVEPDRKRAIEAARPTPPGRLGPDRRQGTRRLPDLRRSRHPL